MSVSGTSQLQAAELIPSQGDLADSSFREKLITAVAQALDGAFAEGIEHFESAEFLSKVADLARRGAPP